MPSFLRNGLAGLSLAAIVFAIGCGAESNRGPAADATTGLSPEPTESPAVEETPPPSAEVAAADPPPAETSTYPSIEDLPALAGEAPKDEKLLGFVTVGDFRIRDGVYQFTLKSGEGEREILMSLQTRSNGFSLKRGEGKLLRTNLRWIVEGDAVKFASDGPGDAIAGTGTPSGDDWIQGTYRSQNLAGERAEGTFELRKLFAPRPTVGG